MSSRTLTLYLHPQIAARLANAKRLGRSAAEEVRLLTDIVSEIEGASVPALLEPQWALLLDVLVDYPIRELRDIKHLPYVVDDKLRGTDAARRRLVEGDGFVYRLRALKLHELVALCAELDRRRRQAAGQGEPVDLAAPATTTT